MPGRFVINACLAPGWFRGLQVASCLMWSAIGAAAQDLRLPLQAGHQDLALYVLTQRESRVSPDGRALLHNQGFLHDPQGAALQRLPSGHALTPTLRHDTNINDGIPSDTINIGGLEFTVTEDSRAKDAVLAGLQYARWDRFSLGPASRLTVTQLYLAEIEPTYGYDHFAANVRICADRPVADWTWADACLSGGYDNDSIDEDRSVTGSIGGRRMFNSPVGFHQAQFSVARTAMDDYQKSVLQLGLVTLTPEHGMWSVNALLGEKIPGENSMRYFAGLEWSGELLERQVTLGASHMRTDGAALFGVDRVDDISRLSVSTVAGRFDLGGYVENQQSTIDAYDSTNIGMTFGLRYDLMTALALR
ncbi:MAG: hypothetical protein ACK5LJ_00735 [Paracoccus sp. (in: a-proteobacteria)]